MPGCGKRGISFFSLSDCECNQLALVANLVLTEGTTVGSGGYGPPRQAVRVGGIGAWGHSPGILMRKYTFEKPVWRQFKIKVLLPMLFKYYTR